MTTQDITLARNDLLGVCNRVASHGEECIFFSVNISTEDIFCCGSSYGQEFLTDRATIVQAFLEFCKEKYSQNQQQPVQAEVKTELNDDIQNDITNKAVKYQTTDDDVICILSDDEEEEEDEFDELTAVPMATKTENSDFTIEIERLDSEEPTDNLHLSEGEKVPLETNVNTFNNTEKKIKKDACDNVIEKNDNNDNDDANKASNLSSNEKNEINNEITEDVDLRLETKKESDTSLPTKDSVLSVQGDVDTNLPTKDSVSSVQGGIRVCQICGESFFSFKALQNHMNLHKSKREVQKDYMRTHAEEKPFCCNICGKQCQDKGPLTNHMKIHKNLSSVAEVAQNDTVKSGKRSLERYQCKICDVKFKTSYLLKTHKENIHNNTTQDNMCCVCEKHFTSWYSLKMHTLTHFRDRQKTNKKCRYCSKLFANSGNCKRHEKLHEKQQKLKVNVKSVRKISNDKIKTTSAKKMTNKLLKSYLPYHKHDMFKCQICNFTTKRHFDLKLHALKHFRHDKHNCGVCGKHFDYPYQLRNHWKMHINPKSEKLTETKKKILEKGKKGNQTKKKNSKDGENVIKIKKTRIKDKREMMTNTKKDLENVEKSSKNKTDLENELCNVNGMNLTGAYIETLTCKICNRNFNAKSNLVVHMKRHLSKNLHQCKICKQTFKLFSYLKIHLALKHQVHQKLYRKLSNVIPIGSKNSKEISCQSCGKSFTHGRYLTKHINSNDCQRPKGFKCSICYQVFKDLARLKVHSIKCTVVSRPCQCKICGKRCATVGNLRQHTAIHRKDDIKVKTQKRRAKNNSAPKLGDGAKLKSPKQESEFSQNSVDAKTFDCQPCGRHFNSARGLANHKKMHSRQAAKVGSMGSKPVLEKTFYLCRLCDEAFEDSNLLKKHYWKIHGDQEKLQEKPFQCKTCLKTFFDKGVLKWHESTHLQNKPYQCKICNVKVFGSETFKIHMQFHDVYSK